MQNMTDWIDIHGQMRFSMHGTHAYSLRSWEKKERERSATLSIFVTINFRLASKQFAKNCPLYALLKFQWRQLQSASLTSLIFSNYPRANIYIFIYLFIYFWVMNFKQLHFINQVECLYNCRTWNYFATESAHSCSCCAPVQVRKWRIWTTGNPY